MSGHQHISTSAAHCGYARVINRAAREQQVPLCTAAGRFPLGAAASPTGAASVQPPALFPWSGERGERATNPRSGFLLGRLAGETGESPAHTRAASRQRFFCTFFPFLFLFFSSFIGAQRGGLKKCLVRRRRRAGRRRQVWDYRRRRLERTSGPIRVRPVRRSFRPQRT